MRTKYVAILRWIAEFDDSESVEWKGGQARTSGRGRVTAYEVQYVKERRVAAGDSATRDP